MKLILGFSPNFWEMLEANLGVGGEDCQGVVEHCMEKIQKKLAENNSEDLIKIFTLLNESNEQLSNNDHDSFRKGSQKVKNLIKDIIS